MFNPFTLARQIRQLREENESRRLHIHGLNAALDDNSREIRRLKCDLAEAPVKAKLTAQTDPASEPQIVGTLAATTADNPLWRALHTLLARQTELERDYALRPGLTDDDRQYYAGRAAGLLEFQAGLTAKHLQCQKTNE